MRKEIELETGDLVVLRDDSARLAMFSFSVDAPSITSYSEEKKVGSYTLEKNQHKHSQGNHFYKVFLRQHLTSGYE